MFGDSNKVALYVSPETTWGETPATPTMTQVRMTGESLNFEKSTVVSNQIRSDRQRDSVAVTGYKSQGGVNLELAYGTLDPFLPSLFSTDEVVARLTALTLTLDHTAKTIARSAGSWIADGVVVGQNIRTYGLVASTGVNNKVWHVTAVTALTLTVRDVDNVMVDEGPVAACTVKLGMYRNGSKKYSVLLEKQFLDLSLFEWFNGMVPATCNLSLSASQIITAALTFMGKNTGGMLGATVSSVLNAAASTTSMTASANAGHFVENAANFTGTIKQLTIDITQNLRFQEAVGTPYAAGVGYGFWEAKGNLDVYFQDATLYNNMKNHDYIGIEFQCVDEVGNTIVFTIPRINLGKATAQAAGGNQDVMLTLEYTAVRDSVTNCTMQVDVLPASAA